MRIRCSIISKLVDSLSYGHYGDTVRAQYERRTYKPTSYIRGTSELNMSCYLCRYEYPMIASS